MNKSITKYQLFTAFIERRPITINNFRFTVINSIEHEDGSGSSYNVTGYGLSKEKAHVDKGEHVRTVD